MFYISAILCLTSYLQKSLPSILNLQKKSSCKIYYCQNEGRMFDKLTSILADVEQGTILRERLCDMTPGQLEEYINNENPYIIFLEDGEGHQTQNVTDSFHNDPFVASRNNDVQASSLPMPNHDLNVKSDYVFNLERYFEMNFDAVRFQPLYGNLNRFFFPKNDRHIAIPRVFLEGDILPLVVKVFDKYLNRFRSVQNDANYDGRRYTGRDKIKHVAERVGYNEEKIAFEIFQIFLKSRQKYPENFYQIKNKIETMIINEGFEAIREQRWFDLSPLERAIAYLYSVFSIDTELESIWFQEGTTDEYLDFITPKAVRFPKMLRSALYATAKNFGPN